MRCSDDAQDGVHHSHHTMDSIPDTEERPPHTGPRDLLMERTPPQVFVPPSCAPSFPSHQGIVFTFDLFMIFNHRVYRRLRIVLGGADRLSRTRSPSGAPGHIVYVSS